MDYGLGGEKEDLPTSLPNLSYLGRQIATKAWVTWQRPAGHGQERAPDVDLHLHPMKTPPESYRSKLSLPSERKLALNGKGEVDTYVYTALYLTFWHIILQAFFFMQYISFGNLV